MRFHIYNDDTDNMPILQTSEASEDIIRLYNNQVRLSEYSRCVNTVNRNAQIPYILAPLLFEDWNITLNVNRNGTAADVQNGIDILRRNHTGFSTRTKEEVDPKYLNIHVRYVPNTAEYETMITAAKEIGLEFNELFAQAITTTKSHLVNVSLYKVAQVLTIFTNKWDYRTLYRVIATLPAVFSDIPRSEKFPIELFRLLGTEDYEAWEPAFKTWVEPILEIKRQEERKKNLEDAINHVFNQKGIIIRQTIGNLQSQINDYERHLSGYYNDLQRANMDLLGYEALGTGPDHSAEIKFLLNKPEIRKIIALRGSSSKFELHIETKLNNYDMEIAQNLFSASRENYVNKNAQRKAFFDAVFLARTWTLHVADVVTVDFVNNTFSVKQEGSHTNEQTICSQKTAIVNPHLTLFRCWGNYGRQITANLSKGEYAMAFELIINAVQCINWSDGSVGQRFMDIACSTDRVGMIKYPKALVNNTTGERISIQEFVSRVR